MTVRHEAAWLVALMLVAWPAGAQRRDGGSTLPVLEVTLPVPVRLGDTVVAARRYRLTLAGGAFALADPQSMVVVATLPVHESTTDKVLEQAEAKVVQQGAAVVISLHHLDRVYTATGHEAEPKHGDTTLVKHDGKAEAVLAAGSTAEQSEQSLVEQALPRYEASLKDCADRAQRARWTTDHPQFARCVCPQTEKWRMPKVTRELRLHRPLAKGKSGYSLTVTSAGKVTQCRVWVGGAPPAEELAESNTQGRAPDEAQPRTEKSKP